MTLFRRFCLNVAAPLALAASLAASLVVAAPPARAEVVKIGGTGAVTALLVAMAEPFQRFSPQDTLEVLSGLGSSGGTAAVEAGAIALAVTGRPLSPKEVAQGLLVLPMLETPFIFCTARPEPFPLTTAGLIRIYAGEVMKYPNGESIGLILRPRGDAQTLFMLRSISGMDEALAKARLRPELPVAGNDQDNMEAARRLAGAFSGFPLTQLMTEPNTLQRLPLDGAEPTLAAARAGAYKLKLQVTLIVRADMSPGAKRFVAFLDSPEAVTLMEKYGADRTR